MKRIFAAAATMAGVLACVLMTFGPGTANAATSEPAAASGLGKVGTSITLPNCDGRQEQFRVGQGHHLYHRYQTSPGGSWTGWISLGGYLISAQIGGVRNSDCRLEVFGVGDDYGPDYGAMWHIWQTTAGSGPWSGWNSLGGLFNSGPTAAWVSGNGEAFLQAYWVDYGVVYDNQTVPSSGPWTGWYAPE